MFQVAQNRNRVEHSDISLYHLVKLFDRYFRQVGVPEESLLRIFAVSRKWPPVSGFIIEKHLSDTCSRTDFSVRINGDTNEKASYYNYLTSLQYTNAAQNWLPVLGFFSEWNMPGSILSKWVEHVWLEFDNPPQGNMPDAASLFFDVDPNNLLTVSERQIILFNGLAALKATPEPDQSSNIIRCLQRLPPDAGLHYAGLMIPRNTGDIRLCIKGLSALQILTYLDEIGCEGNRSSLNNALLRYAGNCKKFILHIDVSGHTCREAGLEFNFTDKDDWVSFLHVLVADKIIGWEESRALLAYPGHEAMPEGGLEQHLSGGKSKPGIHLVRRLNHVKLTFPKTGIIKAKAYLYACYHIIE